MEKAVLKTLIYADIFDYPLKAYEIHKWLIGRRVSLRQVEKGLEILSKKSKVKRKKDYFFLPRRISLVNKRERRNQQSNQYLRKLQIIIPILRLVPWIKLVGISGGLAMQNAAKSDDIDLFLITAKNRLWISRLFTLGLLSLTGQRRKVKERGRKIAGKICLNILLEEDKLVQDKKDIYIAHEVLQMKVLWQRGGIYSKYLEDNGWVFKFLPNWMGNKYQVVSSKYYGKDKKSLNTKYSIPNTITNLFENLAKRFQLWYMKKPMGMERIEDGALYFHPHDIRLQVLKEYKQRLKSF